MLVVPVVAGTTGADAKKREEMGNSMLRLGDEESTFLLKIKDLVDEYQVEQPSVTIQYEVRNMRACRSESISRRSITLRHLRISSSSKKLCWVHLLSPLSAVLWSTPS